MVKPLDKNKVKIKHLLYVEGENYPTEEDCLYEILDCLQQQNMLDKSFTKSHVISQVKGRYNGMKMVDMLKYFANKGYFEMSSRGGNNSFKVLTHPWE
jgi:hypothetical protein